MEDTKPYCLGNWTLQELAERGLYLKKRIDELTDRLKSHKASPGQRDRWHKERRKLRNEAFELSTFIHNSKFLEKHGGN